MCMKKIVILVAPQMQYGKTKGFHVGKLLIFMSLLASSSSVSAAAAALSQRPFTIFPCKNRVQRKYRLCFYIYFRLPSTCLRQLIGESSLRKLVVQVALYVFISFNATSASFWTLVHCMNFSRSYL